LYSINGQLLSSSAITENETSIDISSYTRGIYFLSASIADAIHTIKVVKE